MKIIFSCLIAIVLLPFAAFAKRGAPAKVEPVVHQGIRYAAPNDNGRRAYLVATDVASGKKLWDVTVFQNRINPELEEDVQHVYIKSMKLIEGTLILTSEHGRKYQVDLKTKEVTQAK